jgi:hypothetical protein
MAGLGIVRAGPAHMLRWPSIDPDNYDMEEDDEHSAQLLSNPISESQRINFTEAALIRHFQPEYNDHFKTSFPNPAHKTYRDCYDLDLNAVFVELNSETIWCRLYSSAVSPTWTHLPHFLLHDPKERAAMIDILTPGEEPLRL